MASVLRSPAAPQGREQSVRNSSREVGASVGMCIAHILTVNWRGSNQAGSLGEVLEQAIMKTQQSMLKFWPKPVTLRKADMLRQTDMQLSVWIVRTERVHWPASRK